MHTHLLSRYTRERENGQDIGSAEVTTACGLTGNRELGGQHFQTKKGEPFKASLLWTGCAACSSGLRRGAA